MLNQQSTNTSAQVDKFTEALASVRKMQQDWLQYGINFLHIYVEDADGDWLENWGNDEIDEIDKILDDALLNSIKEFLVSDDYGAVKIRQVLQNQAARSANSLTLFDLAVNLVECCQINPEIDRLCAIRNLLAWVGKGDAELLDLANHLVEKLSPTPSAG
jgi:hypothetical protein